MLSTSLTTTGITDTSSLQYVFGNQEKPNEYRALKSRYPIISEKFQFRLQTIPVVSTYLNLKKDLPT